MPLLKKSVSVLLSLLAPTFYKANNSNAQTHFVSDTTIVNTVEHYSPQLRYPHIFELYTKKNYTSEHFVALLFSNQQGVMDDSVTAAIKGETPIDLDVELVLKKGNGLAVYQVISQEPLLPGLDDFEFGISLRNETNNNSCSVTYFFRTPNQFETLLATYDRYYDLIGITRLNDDYVRQIIVPALSDSFPSGDIEPKFITLDIDAYPEGLVAYLEMHKRGEEGDLGEEVLKMIKASFDQNSLESEAIREFILHAANHDPYLIKFDLYIVPRNKKNASEPKDGIESILSSFPLTKTNKNSWRNAYQNQAKQNNGIIKIILGLPDTTYVAENTNSDKTPSSYGDDKLVVPLVLEINDDELDTLRVETWSREPNITVGCGPKKVEQIPGGYLVTLPVEFTTDSTLSSVLAGVNVYYGTSGIVEPDQDKKVPRAMMLYQNYPNPFNPRTTIDYYLSRQVDDLKMIFYDARGRRIRTVPLGDKNKGHYYFEFDGRNDRGELLDSGVYFYRLEGKGIKSKKRKMVNLK
jgi:hypothetical protein